LATGKTARQNSIFLNKKYFNFKQLEIVQKQKKGGIILKRKHKTGGIILSENTKQRNYSKRKHKTGGIILSENTNQAELF
jgi:hypothetical protein